MSRPEEVDKLLFEFLVEQKKADLLGTVQRIADRQLEFEGEVRGIVAELRGEIRGLSIRVGKLEQADEKLEKKVEQSGSWDREALIAQHATTRDDLNWWRRNWLVIAIALASLATSIASFFKGGK